MRESNGSIGENWDGFQRAKVKTAEVLVSKSVEKNHHDLMLSVKQKHCPRRNMEEYRLKRWKEKTIHERKIENARTSTRAIEACRNVNKNLLFLQKFKEQLLLNVE